MRTILSTSNHIDQIIQTFDLLPHPEGGYFKETYRSSTEVKLPEFEGKRTYGTAIYYLLKSENFSAFHRIKQDETWHFYDGSALNLHVITKEGIYQLIKIGRNVTNGEVFQFTVEAGDWFGASVSEVDSFSLCGCTVAPGFDFRDFEMPDPDELIKVFPQHEKVIRSLVNYD